MERLRRSKRIAKVNGTSREVYRDVKPRHNMVFVPFTEHSEYAFLDTAQRAVSMFDVAALTAFLNRPDKAEDVADMEDKTEVKGDEGNEVPAVPVSFEDESYDDDDDDDGQDTQKLESPTASNKNEESNEESDSYYYGDLRDFVRGQQPPLIDLSKLKGSDFSSDSSNDASDSGGDEK